MSPNDARAYISQYFYPLTNGDHAMRVNNKFEILEDTVVNKTFFKRMPQLITFKKDHILIEK